MLSASKVEKKKKRGELRCLIYFVSYTSIKLEGKRKSPLLNYTMNVIFLHSMTFMCSLTEEVQIHLILVKDKQQKAKTYLEGHILMSNIKTGNSS